jgi:hypothetical protein
VFSVQFSFSLPFSPFFFKLSVLLAIYNNRQSIRKLLFLQTGVVRFIGTLTGMPLEEEMPSHQCSGGKWLVPILAAPYHAVLSFWKME